MASARPRSRKATWMQMVLPYWADYRSTNRSNRSGFLLHVSRATGKATNTLYRQFEAMAYLEMMGADLASLASQPPPLMSIEAVERMGVIDQNAERQAFHKMMAGQGSVLAFRDQLQELRLPQHDLVSTRWYLPRRLSLSQIITDYLSTGLTLADVPVDRSDLQQRLRVAPLVFEGVPIGMHIEQGTPPKTTAILVADGRNPLTRRDRFQELFEGFALRSLVICDQVVVCTNFDLPDLERTSRAMRKELRKALSIEFGELVVDVEIPSQTTDFDNLHDFLVAKA